MRPQGEGGMAAGGIMNKRGKEEGNQKEEWKKGDKWNKML